MKIMKIVVLTFAIASTVAAGPLFAQTAQAQPTMWEQVVDYVNQWSVARKIHDYFFGSDAAAQPPEVTTQQLMQRAQNLPNLTPLEQRQEVADLTKQSAQMIGALPADQKQEIQRMAVQFSRLTPQEQQAQALKLISQSQDLLKSLPPEQQAQVQQAFSQANTYLRQAQEQQRPSTGAR